MTVLPTEVKYGKVVGQILFAVADTADVDRLPDAAAPGNPNSVKFTAVTPVRRTTLPPVTIIKREVVCSLDVNGFLIDNQGNQGVWLPEGQWRVAYTITGVTGLDQTITVTEAHTDVNPLDLTLAMPPTGPEPTASQWEDLNTRLVDVETFGIEGDGSITMILRLTQAEYDALVVKDPTTMYVISG